MFSKYSDASWKIPATYTIVEVLDLKIAESTALSVSPDVYDKGIRDFTIRCVNTEHLK